MNVCKEYLKLHKTTQTFWIWNILRLWYRFFPKVMSLSSAAFYAALHPVIVGFDYHFPKFLRQFDKGYVTEP
jgi:hypothetical protein